MNDLRENHVYFLYLTYKIQLKNWGNLFSIE